MDRLKGKVAVITGAGTGLGRATATLFAEEGAKVVVADVRDRDGEQTVRMIQDTGGDAVFVHTDVARSADLKEAVELAERRYGALHIMVANAGIRGAAYDKQPVDVTEKEFWELIQVNLAGVWFSFQQAIPAIQRAGGGAMTATVSLAAHRGLPNVVYSATKGGVAALVRSMAYVLAPKIRVNGVSPGAMTTEFVRHGLETKGLAAAEIEARMKKIDAQPEVPRSRVRRVANPREIAQGHLFLVSDEASFVNGQILAVDSGWISSLSD